ncbi:MAG: AtpZ/AtpI family protein [Planctomycetes bacterium]|nr:AtpZ/AtpI family protein [Planctomycetota bacterium]
MTPSEPRPNTAEAESRRLWRLAAMGGTMASEILAGTLIGWAIDAIFGTKPMWIVICTIAGVIVGMATFIRSAMSESRQAGRAGRDFAARHHHDQPGDDDDDSETR